ncbi:hypothetical protein AST13_02330 [Staphylococcus xylosus]|uniref:hypothetical protein n=1 Tax=Staphylococcus xylosus TaxID=1288 RepID=UPI000853323E|nr:hypothetical protein [Staphylococcus xylosus]OEL06896.1 hypothetical protein AST13_02330 [Staphylococcus xylosus]
MIFKNFNTYFEFYETKKSGPYPNEKLEAPIFKCKGEKYNNSIKDITILGNDTQTQSFTLIMRDSSKEFVPKFNHKIQIKDKRFDSILFNIFDIRFDKPQKGYITLVVSERD